GLGRAVVAGEDQVVGAAVKLVVVVAARKGGDRGAVGAGRGLAGALVLALGCAFGGRGDARRAVGVEGDGPQRARRLAANLRAAIRDSAPGGVEFVVAAAGVLRPGSGRRGRRGG